jgi:UDP-N-acetylmuramate dehydrogenase
MPLTIEKSKDLSSCNTLRLSAQAQYFCEVESIDDWREALIWAKASGLAVTILGGGSNVVLAPRILGLVVHPSNSD